MNPIDEKATFTRPRFLTSGFHSQVILCNCRLSGRSADKPITCVLKFFPSRFQLCFEKEIHAYRRLLESNTTLKYPKPYGYAEWSTAKYIKTIGRNIVPLIGADNNVFVLILQYVEVGDTSSSSISLELAVAAMESLNLLHKEKIVHGDISIDNILAIENETTADITWLDFSCSWTDASMKQIQWEWDKAAEYFAKLANVKATDLLAKTSVFSSAPRVPKATTTGGPAVPLISDDMKFGNHTLMSKGTHSLIFQAVELGVENSPLYCIKLFRKTWDTPFNLELAAYERLLPDKWFKKYSPIIYGYGHRTLSEWGFDRSPDDKDIYSAIVMEWIENAAPLTAANANVQNTSDLITGLSRIHAMRVLHNDTYLRNTLVLPEGRRAMWIDLSCAHMNEESSIPQEMKNTTSSILWKLSESARRKGISEAISAYASYTPLSRRIWALSYSFTLALEGLVWLFGRSVRANSSPTRLPFPTDYGPLNLFTSALLATDSCAIHLHSPLFQIAWVIKLMYPLFSASLASMLLLSKTVSGFHQIWIAVRLLFTVLWICSCMAEVKWWEIRPLPEIPGIEYMFSSDEASSESESVASDDSRDIFDRQPFVPYDERS